MAVNGSQRLNEVVELHARDIEAPRGSPGQLPRRRTKGKPRFDLTRFDPAYFERLRDRVAAAGAVGIYVSVMLFEGFSLHLTETPTNITGHPFHGANNVNGVDIASIVDCQEYPLAPTIEALQVAYIRHVVDTVHDLPNVLYGVANESSGVSADVVTMPDGTTIDTPSADSTEWQYWVIDVLKRHERDAGRTPHPIGMTFQFPVADQRASCDSRPDRELDQSSTSPTGGIDGCSAEPDATSAVRSMVTRRFARFKFTSPRFRGRCCTVTGSGSLGLAAAGGLSPARRSIGRAEHQPDPRSSHAPSRQPRPSARLVERSTIDR